MLQDVDVGLSEPNEMAELREHNERLSSLLRGAQEEYVTPHTLTHSHTRQLSTARAPTHIRGPAPTRTRTYRRPVLNVVIAQVVYM